MMGRKNLPWTFLALLLLFTFLVFIFVMPTPKVSWISDSIWEPGRPQMSAESLQRYLKVMDQQIKLRRSEDIKAGLTKPAPFPSVSSFLLRMFPLYSEQKNTEKSELSETNTNRSSKFEKTSTRVNVFRLRNFDFSNFGKTWQNEPHGTENYKVFNSEDFKIKERHKSPEHSGKDASLLDDETHDLFRLRSNSSKMPDCVRLRVPYFAPPTKICVHSSKDDSLISNQVRDEGHWDETLVGQMENFFVEHFFTSQLVDLGCNIGVFTLHAASMGVPVLAVDILPANLALLQMSVLTNDQLASEMNETKKLEYLRRRENVLGDLKPRLRNKKDQTEVAASFQIGQMSKLVRIIHNAVHSHRMKMKLDFTDDGNLGGLRIKHLPSNASITEELNSRSVIVDAVCLDDMVPYVIPGKSVYLKLDVEGSEPDVLQCADEFFTQLDVRVVQIETMLSKNRLKEMAMFLIKHDLFPSKSVTTDGLLDPDLMGSWPNDMFWLKVR